MIRIPTLALIPGALALIPLVWAAVTHISPAVSAWAGERVPLMWMGRYLGLTWGTAVLCLMAGALWGVTLRAEGGGLARFLSLAPAGWGFFTVTDATDASVIQLAAGFVALAVLDWTLSRRGMTPAWWWSARLSFTLTVLACLAALMA